MIIMIVGIVILGKFLDLTGIAIAFVSASAIEAIYLMYYSKIRNKEKI